MRRRLQALLVAITFMALPAWSGPAMPADCPHLTSCHAMHGGPAACAAWRGDSGCCRLGAPVGQIPSETALGGPAAAPAFLVLVVLSDAPASALLPPLARQRGIVQSLAPPLYLLHASFLN